MKDKDNSDYTIFTIGSLVLFVVITLAIVSINVDDYPEGKRWIEQGVVIDLGQCTKNYCSAAARFGTVEMGVTQYMYPMSIDNIVYRRCYETESTGSRCYNQTVNPDSKPMKRWVN